MRECACSRGYSSKGDAKEIERKCAQVTAPKACTIADVCTKKAIERVWIFCLCKIHCAHGLLQGWGRCGTGSYLCMSYASSFEFFSTLSMLLYVFCICNSTVASCSACHAGHSRMIDRRGATIDQTRCDAYWILAETTCLGRRVFFRYPIQSANAHRPAAYVRCSCM